MPLTVDYKHIPFWKEKFLIEDPETGKPMQDPWVFVVGVFSMHVGISEITRENAAEFYVRCKLVEACFGGALMQSGRGENVPITPEIVERFVGVRTNVKRYTATQFYKHLREDVTGNLRDHFNYTRRNNEREVAEKVEASLEKSKS